MLAVPESHNLTVKEAHRAFSRRWLFVETFNEQSTGVQKVENNLQIKPGAEPVPRRVWPDIVGGAACSCCGQTTLNCLP